jgi:hypothetical protein
MSPEFISNPLGTGTDQEENNEIKPTQKKHRSNGHPGLYEEKRSYQEHDHDNAGDNLADRKEYILDERHRIPQFLIKICGIPFQKKFIGASSIRLED